MPPPNKQPSRHSTAADTTIAVEALLAELSHPFKAEVLAIRAAVLEADSRIQEGVKWNSPSFRTHEYFATTHLREKDGIGVILHLGAKARELGPGGLRVADPDCLLKWLAPDRAAVRFTGMTDFKAKRQAFVELIRAWIQHV